MLPAAVPASSQGKRTRLSMRGDDLDLNEPPRTEERGGESVARYATLMKDNKPICHTKYFNVPFELPTTWTISKFDSRSNKCALMNLPRQTLYPEPQNNHQKHEWPLFMRYLCNQKKVAVIDLEGCTLYIHPPDGNIELPHAVLTYNISKPMQQLQKPVKNLSSPSSMVPQDFDPTLCFQEESGDNGSTSVDATNAPQRKRVPGQNDEFVEDAPSTCQQTSPKVDSAYPRNFVRTDPSYLRTLSQTHAGWIFGGIAELVDNSRDANATRLDIFIELLYSKKAKKKVPVFSVIDDGHGMSHKEIIKMLSFGHKQSTGEDPNRIGRFGIGFKTGAMRLGRDALILTQTSESRSVALLSQSYNQNKEILEIPIVTYRKKGQYMEVDLSIQSEECASSNLDAIKEFSHFNEYFIGEKLGKFGEYGTGTQIYIWNLDKWGSNYSLEWDNENVCHTSHQGCRDILIRSRRVRSRPGQISQKVPLDYSLQAYLEVIFLNPRMKIYVQGSLAKSRPLAKYLNRTVQVSGKIMGRTIQLTLGRSKLEWERMNCGIFLYWHGRLIEAYKRVGEMIHNADVGRGVLGVVDVTNLKDPENGDVFVLNNKQGFPDCEAYAVLEGWLADRTNEYLDKNSDTLNVIKGGCRYEPDHEWVQCNKCRKWRILDTDFDSKSLPAEWFCYMPPFDGKCEIPEQASTGAIIISEKRSGYEGEHKITQCEEAKNTTSKPRGKIAKRSAGNIPDADGCNEDSSSTEEMRHQPVFRRLRRGPARSCKRL